MKKWPLKLMILYTQSINSGVLDWEMEQNEKRRKFPKVSNGTWVLILN